MLKLKETQFENYSCLQQTVCDV